MKPRIPAPRLLPATIAMLTLVLVMKTGLLVRSALVTGQQAGLISTAWAGHDAAKPPEKREARPSEHGSPAKAEPEPPKAPEKPPIPEGPPPVSEAEKTLLLELRERRKELETRDAAIAARESIAAAAEKKLSSRVEELQALQKRLEGLDANRKQQEDSAWQGLVKVYETMKPRDAAAIFNDLAMPVLISVLDRMKESKAAAVMAAMSPDRAREATTQLALSRTRAATAPPIGGKSAPPPPPGKPPASGT